MPSFKITSWNVTSLSEFRLENISLMNSEIFVLQETHLPPLALETRTRQARRLGLLLIHGRPADNAKRRGVGFLLRSITGVTAFNVSPLGNSWKSLWQAQRLHVIKLPPRRGLPLGLIIVNVYSPAFSTTPHEKAESLWFCNEFISFVSALDLNIPTILCGDWNGSQNPKRDYEGPAKNRLPDPLLVSLTGPGGHFTDLFDIFPESWTFTYWGGRGNSKCDSILLNRSCIPLVKSFRVLSHIRDGGHSPLELVLHPLPGNIVWSGRLQRLPRVLSLSAEELKTSAEFKLIMLKWKSSERFKEALLGKSLKRAIDDLIDLSGGWRKNKNFRPKLAFQSDTMKMLRKRLTLLSRLHSAVTHWNNLDHLKRMVDLAQKENLLIAMNDKENMKTAVNLMIKEVKKSMYLEFKKMMEERNQRWNGSLAKIWKRSPRKIFSWLQEEKAKWGETPLLNKNGMLVCDAAEVDKLAQEFWVAEVWNRDHNINPEKLWDEYSASAFVDHIPKCNWPTLSWDADKVANIVKTMKISAPGTWGVPVAVWKNLGAEWYEAVALALQNVLETGIWPEEALKAYVVLIPKGNGNKIEDQRPITVLELFYRIFARGWSNTWKETLDKIYLGPAATGFRPATSARHMAQIISDVIQWRTANGKEIWVAKLDFRKCYDSVPWWAIWGTMNASGIDPRVIRAFKNFYSQLRRVFRFGSFDGDPWGASNGLAQGCPAAPEKLNLLLEPFHRWAMEEKLGLNLGIFGFLPSLSFADDVALIAESRHALTKLLNGYMEWCKLVTFVFVLSKTLVWTNCVPSNDYFRVGDTMVKIAETFTIAGVTFAKTEQLSETLHFGKRFEKAKQTTERLSALKLPVPIKARLWRTVVLTQALYGCEIRDPPKEMLEGLAVKGRIALRSSSYLNRWAAPEALMGNSIGDWSFKDPCIETRQRQLRWIQELANSRDLAGNIHRGLAVPETVWEEISPNLSAALEDFKISMTINPESLEDWPNLPDEEVIQPEICLEPSTEPLRDNFCFTDGSVIAGRGGAAAVFENLQKLVVIEKPRSSTHCELAAISLAVRNGALAVYSDSLAALVILQNWDSWKLSKQLRCKDRLEIRSIRKAMQENKIHLEKVKAHTGAQDTKSFWNDKADKLASRFLFAPTPEHPNSKRWWDHASLTKDGEIILDLEEKVETWMLNRKRLQMEARRPESMGKIYPSSVLFHWAYSNVIFNTPKVINGKWIFRTPITTAKWVARARSGALASTARLFKNYHRSEPPTCPACKNAEEDDLHMLSQCVATGADALLTKAQTLWLSIIQSNHIETIFPPADWFQKWKLQFAVALIPLEALRWIPASSQSSFFPKFSQKMAEYLAEVLQKREATRFVHVAPQVPQASALPGLTLLDIRSPQSPDRPGTTYQALNLDDLVGWIRKLGPNSVVDPSTQQAWSSEALLILFETTKGPLEEKTTFGRKLQSWSQKLKLALKAAGPPYSCFEVVNKTTPLAPNTPRKRHWCFPLCIADPPEKFKKTWKLHLIQSAQTALTKQTTNPAGGTDGISDESVEQIQNPDPQFSDSTLSAHGRATTASVT